MKKFSSFILCLIISLVCAFGFTACGEKDKNAVNLFAVDANNVGLMSDIDYYVVPEPAASAKVKALNGLNFVGDLQALYGGENGYPQAVVVAKNTLIGSDILTGFITEISTAHEWLLSEENQISTIVNAISSRLTSGLTPSITTNNLTRPVMQNCSIKFISSTDSRQDVLTFMESFNSVSESPVAMPSDEFFCNGTGDAQYSGKISVYAPDGAPALGLAKLIAENSLSNIEYHVVNANTIQTFVGGENPKADICVLPVNLAVKLLGNAQNYRLIGTLTHGNLYLLSKSDKKINGDNLQYLLGKSVGVVNLAQVPGLTFKIILKNHGMKFVEPYND